MDEGSEYVASSDLISLLASRQGVLQLSIQGFFNHLFEVEALFERDEIIQQCDWISYRKRRGCCCRGGWPGRGGRCTRGRGGCACRRGGWPGRGGRCTRGRGGCACRRGGWPGRGG